MAPVNVQFPREAALSGVRKERIGWRDCFILSAAVSVCCAASVFALLCKFQPNYPVAPVHEQVVALSITPPPVQPHAAAQVTESQPAPAVAHTHKELLALERLGQRHYIEFTIARSNTFQPVGPIELGFWRADTRLNSAGASVLVGQHRLDLGQVKVDERVLIPVAQAENLELVINHVSRNQISGYLSEPKDKQWQFARVIGSVLP